jgi:hypothetical protein
MPHLPARRTVRLLLSSIAAAIAVAAPAQAGTAPLGNATIAYTDASRSTCEDPAWTHPYTDIGDFGTYVLAPHGSFTDGVAPGWQLRGGASFVDDPARGTSLNLPAGASVISPGMCVDLNYPHARLAHKVVGAGASNLELRVEVVYPQLASPGWTAVRQFGGSQGDAVASGWRISPEVDLKPQLGGDAWGARYVALRITAIRKSSTSASFLVDDVYVDPRMRA